MILAVMGGYLLGSVPFGILAARMGGLGDLRQIGSGNIGATNVLRTGRKDLALFTLIGDSGKGAAAVLIAHLLTDDPGVIALAGAAAFTGHLFPVWLKFKGGKGVATFLGVMLAAWWPAGLAACAVWLAMAFALRYSSLAALTAAAMSPMLVFLLDGPYAYMLLALFMALLVFFRHRENIQRLIKNEEPRIGKKTPSA